MRFKERELYCIEAVQFGALSGDPNLHALALSWHGNTYTNCYFQPQNAIDHLNNALKCGNDVSLLNKTDISLELAIAYALNEDEANALNYIELAHMTMPDNPELDSLYKLIDLGQSELDAREGIVYLILAKRFPQSDYAQMAHAAFAKSISTHTFDIGNRCGALLYKAVAACGIGNMDDYFVSLKEGGLIAGQTGNQKRIGKAVNILQKTPLGWRNEQQYKDLCEILAPNSVIAYG